MNHFISQVWTLIRHHQAHDTTKLSDFCLWCLLLSPHSSGLSSLFKLLILQTSRSNSLIKPHTNPKQQPSWRSIVSDSARTIQSATSNVSWLIYRSMRVWTESRVMVIRGSGDRAGDLESSISTISLLVVEEMKVVVRVRLWSNWESLLAVDARDGWFWYFVRNNGVLREAIKHLWNLPAKYVVMEDMRLGLLFPYHLIVDSRTQSFSNSQ